MWIRNFSNYFLNNISEIMKGKQLRKWNHSTGVAQNDMFYQERTNLSLPYLIEPNLTSNYKT